MYLGKPELENAFLARVHRLVGYRILGAIDFLGAESMNARAFVLSDSVNVIMSACSPVFSDSVHAGLLADGVDVGTGDSIWSRHIIFQVNLTRGKGLNITIITNPKYLPHLVREIHLGGDGGEDKTLLPSVGQGELDLTIQSVQKTTIETKISLGRV